MKHDLRIRDAVSADHAAINRLAAAAWVEYAAKFTGWKELSAYVANLAALESECELIVANESGTLLGVVGYQAPHRPRERIFPDGWAVVRMLSVHPNARRRGIGTELVHECLDRAVRDGAAIVGLHTSTVMAAALQLYQRLGFVFHAAIPDRRGAPYAVYSLAIGSTKRNPRSLVDHG